MKSKFNVKIFIVIYFLFFVLTVGISYLRSGDVSFLGLTGFPLSSTSGFVVYACLTVTFLQKMKTRLAPKYILLAIWMGVGLLETIYRCVYPMNGHVSIPSTLLWWLGILCGYLYWKVARVWLKIVVVSLLFLFTLWMSYYGYSMWIHKLNFGTFTGKVDKVVSFDYSLFDETSRVIKLSQFRGKFVVLDFWHKTCGVCYSKMPAVESLYNCYKQNPDICIAGVYACKEGEDGQEGNSILKKEGYTYLNFSTCFSSNILKGFGIERFPTVVILNPDGNMIYLGNIEGAVKFVDFIFK